MEAAACRGRLADTEAINCRVVGEGEIAYNIAKKPPVFKTDGFYIYKYFFKISSEMGVDSGRVEEA